MAANMMELARSLAGQLSAWRRDLHRWPELGFCEMLTSCRIARTLTDLGFDQVLVGRDVCFGPGRMGLPSEEVLEEAYAQAAKRGADPVFLAEMEGGFTGVVGILRCGEGPTVALRFDIDALPIQESRDPERLPVREGFVSEHPGVMHACGHDGHTAVGLGVAQVLAACREQLHGTVKLLFQPAEEGVRGAKSMVENGHLDGVDYVLGAHVGACQPGEGPFVGVGSGGTLATAKFDAVFTGKSSHAGMAPQEGRYAMLAAATAVLNLFAIPRHGDAPTRINVGKLTAGTGRNIVCDRAVLELEAVPPRPTPIWPLMPVRFWRLPPPCTAARWRSPASARRSGQRTPLPSGRWCWRRWPRPACRRERSMTDLKSARTFPTLPRPSPTTAVSPATL